MKASELRIMNTTKIINHIFDNNLTREESIRYLDRQLNKVDLKDWYNKQF